jgi:glutamate carboxypeptidase
VVEHDSRPPLERSPGVVALYEKARVAARDIGFDLHEGSTGGGSDGNLTAALGIPTLDGLGIQGGGAHAVDEHILVTDIPLRAALLNRLLETL